MRKTNGLWIGKTGEGNAWYHIYPFAMAENTDTLHVVRYKKVIRDIPRVEYHIFKSSTTIADGFRLFIEGFNVLRQNNVGYIVTFNPVPWGAIAWLLAKIFRKPFILGYIGADFHAHLKSSKFKKLLLFITKYSDVVTVTGSHMTDWLVLNGINRRRIFTYPHCVSDSWLDANLNKEKTKYDLITICELIKRKRVKDIINAVKMLHDDGYKVRLCIVGAGPEQSTLERYVQEKSITEFVHFAGYQKNVKKYLLESDMYVQASDKEGLSLSLIEAMSLGVVPIATIAGSEEDHIEDGVNGYLIPTENPAAIANAVVKLSDKQKYSQMRENVLNYRKNFSIKNAIKTCQILIEKVTEKK